MPATSPPRDNWPRWSLRRSDQAVAGVVLLGAIALVSWHWWQQGMLKSRRIDVDRTPVFVAQFQIDINAADWPEFALLPGVGEVLAKRIVEDRQARGPFRD